MERCAALAFAAGAKASAPMHYRGFSVGCRVITSIIEQREIVALLNDDARFAFPFGDGYWSLLLDRSFVYEGEIERIPPERCRRGLHLRRWRCQFRILGGPGVEPPVRQSSSDRDRSVVANAARLRRNAALNGGRFKVLRRAIGATTGNQVWLSGAKHEAFRVVGEGQPVAGSGESVEMMTLDSLLDRGLVTPRQRLVIKLDVEGMEIDAAKGGKRLLENETVLILEDHGADRAHTVSRYLLNQTPCRVFVFDPASQRYERLIDVSMLDRIKTSTVFGYNIFATNSPSWGERIRSIPPSTRH